MDRWTRVSSSTGSRRHRGADRTNVICRRSQQNRRIVSETAMIVTVGFMPEYFNGRFFYNTELDWQYRLDRLGFAAGPLASSDYYQSHIRLMTELGAICGPAKIALLYSWSAGNDRRGGIANNATSGNIANIDQGTSEQSQLTPRPVGWFRRPHFPIRRFIGHTAT